MSPAEKKKIYDKEYMKGWRADPKNFERIRAAKRRAYHKMMANLTEEGRAKISFNSRRYRDSVLAKKRLGLIDIRKELVKGMRAKAKRANVPLDKTIVYSDLFVPKLCPCCGRKMVSEVGQPSWISPSVDRIFPEKGYVRDNIQVICRRCNTIKNNATVEEIYQVARFVQSLTQGSR